jgi:hopanoid biosynthesis associated protein HpnK
MNLILGADDFGASAEVNEAVATAHRNGVLTSASLMVAGRAVDEAISMARDMPDLAVGLHLVVVDGPAVLPPDRIPHLVDGNRRFLRNPVSVGVRYAFSRLARQELAAEMRAQFERFAESGLSLSHVDGHLHMHLHPVVFDLLVPLAEEYGARGLRLPRDDLRLALRHGLDGVGRKVLWALCFWPLNAWGARQLRGHSLRVVDRVYGFMQTGQMHAAYVLDLIRHLRVPTAEIYFHPSVATEGQPGGPNVGDLDALLDPALRQAMAEREISLTNYPALGQQ